jgi:hypothetical protein
MFVFLFVWLFVNVMMVTCLFIYDFSYFFIVVDNDKSFLLGGREGL